MNKYKNILNIVTLHFNYIIKIRILTNVNLFFSDFILLKILKKLRKNYIFILKEFFAFILKSKTKKTFIFNFC